MSGKTRPDLGIILIEAPRSTGKTIDADILLSDGVVATAAFDSPWPIAEGGYYDVEAKTKDGDSAFVQVKQLSKGESLAKVPKTWFTEAVLGVDGRYGAYGSPTDIKVLSDTTTAEGRSLDIAFTVLSPGSAEVARRAIVVAKQPKGSTDVLLLVSGTSASRWKKREGDARAAASSFRILSQRSSDIKQTPAADYRYGKTSGPESMRSRNDGF